MALLETSRGLIDASLLEVRVLSRDIPAGVQTTTEYLFNGEVVKIDQTIKISEAALEAGGFANL